MTAMGCKAVLAWPEHQFAVAVGVGWDGRDGSFEFFLGGVRRKLRFHLLGASVFITVLLLKLF
jgi:hypothetical protein